MEFKKTKEELSFIEQQFDGEPVMNVIDKDMFEDRVKKVFHLVWDKLSKSFGPGGAGAFISIYPNYYNTKDGFSIMKNVAFDKKLDQVICDMVMNICSRLNFTVGDGTTSAVIATKSVYDAYHSMENVFKNSNILPRDILKRLDYLKNLILEEIDKMAVPIKTDDPKKLRSNIEKVVYISSNANEQITDMIGELYEELMYPAISCVLSKDGTTKSSIINGYKIDVTLTDKIYINNDNNTMWLNGANVIIFSHKVTRETYECILKPLAKDSYLRGKHLVCIAPYYDENALSSIISKDLNDEFKKTRDITLVLTACTKATAQSRVLLGDLAMLLNTTVITPEMERELIKKTKLNNVTIMDVFNFDNRHIPNLNVATLSDDRLRLAPWTESLENVYIPSLEDAFVLGYASEIDLGLKESTFSGFYYDEEVYNKYVSTAKAELEEVQRKCKEIGTFSIELNNKQHRVYSLGLKTGIIEVGSTSEISQGYLKDTVDDAVKAAASAYNNGVVLGCNVTLTNAIDHVFNKIESSELDTQLLCILISGFRAVYSTVLANVLTNVKVDKENPYESFINIIRKNSNYSNFTFDKDQFDEIYEVPEDWDGIDIINLIIDISMATESVFDLSTGEFNNNVINSAETDKEILKATIDLLGLLITGNQLVLC